MEMTPQLEAALIALRAADAEHKACPVTAYHRSYAEKRAYQRELAARARKQEAVEALCEMLGSAA